jgi:Flp pilus assembly protein TadD
LLTPWWTLQPAPLDLCLLRSRIRQGLHDFGAALIDLDAALALDPRNPEAWLLKTMIHEVRGEENAARHGCLQLARFSDELTAATAAAALMGFGRNGAAAAQQLGGVLSRHTDAPATLGAWAWTTLGEIQTELGEMQDAERSFTNALALESESAYTRAAFADLLLRAGRCAEVLQLLDGAQADSLRLRLAEAEVALNPEGSKAKELTRQLEEGFALADARGDELHLRERARFLLRLRQQPRQALAFAVRNWEIQKETADIRLLLDAARAANDEQVFARATEWARAHQPLVLREGKSLSTDR